MSSRSRNAARRRRALPAAPAAPLHQGLFPVTLSPYPVVGSNAARIAMGYGAEVTILDVNLNGEPISPVVEYKVFLDQLWRSPGDFRIGCAWW